MSGPGLGNQAADIHATAVVDPGAIIGAGTRVWHFCHVMSGARIGRGCVLGQNVFVAAQAVVGDGCRIQNNVSLYDGVSLDADVFVGPSVVFTNVLTPRAFVSRRAELVPTEVGRGASIGANATILCGTRLGAFCLVGAGAVVTRDVPAHAAVVGVPARWQGWVCRCGERLTLDAPAEQFRCGRCGAGYRLRARGPLPSAVGAEGAPRIPGGSEGDVGAGPIGAPGALEEVVLAGQELG